MHEYALTEIPLHDVRYCKRQYVDFQSVPGDCPGVAELPSQREIQAARATPATQRP
jgi:hypothetical protein